MKSSRKRGHCLRTILLTITTTACICIVVFIFLEFTDKERKKEIATPDENLFQSEKLTDEKCMPVCDSRSCINQANFLLKTIDPSNDPCENFQNFLCGTYKEKVGEFENRTMMLDMTALMMNRLKNIIEDIKAEPGSAAEKMKIMYDSCVNLGSSELQGVEDFRQILNDVEIFNWPHLAADFEFSDIGIPKLLATFKAYGEARFLTFTAESIHEYGAVLNGKRVKVIYLGGIFKKAVIQRDAATDILEYFDIESEDIETLINDYDTVRSSLISFEEEFQLHTDICEENCSDTHIDCSNTGNVEWVYVCKTTEFFLNITKQNFSKIEIVVNVYSGLYVKNLIPRLKSLSHRSVANFFAINLLYRHLDEINFFFLRKKQKYFNYLKTFEDKRKKTEMPNSNRWEYCVTWLAEKMTMVLEKEVVESYLTPSYIDEIHDFHQTFTSAVGEIIDQQEWISSKAKDLMKEHIEYLDCNMVFLKRNMPNDTYFNEFFKMFNPKRTNFFQNALQYYKSIINVYTRRQLNLYRKYRTVFKADAWTDKESYIALQYGMLMPPIYFPGHEKFINNILIAPLFVHEIGHSINLILREISQSSNITKDIFFERKQCLENQFSKYKFNILDENIYSASVRVEVLTINSDTAYVCLFSDFLEEEKLNGTRYIEENLSDNLGFSIADKMINELDSSGDVFRLPGLSYSPKQLLYMNTRQLFCSKITREEEMRYNTDDIHAPPESRIIGTVQNSREYSEAFNCPEGSNMNPIEKCILLHSN